MLDLVLDLDFLGLKGLEFLGLPSGTRADLLGILLLLVERHSPFRIWL